MKTYIYVYICIYIYILELKHHNKDKYQKNSNFMREERLNEGMENTHSDSTFQITENENEFRWLLCKREFRI